MKNDLTCPLVRDLLPLYVEGLTSDETNAAVESHLNTCPDCARLRSDMADPPAAEAAEQEREVDYLKTVKRNGRRRVVAAVLCTILLISAGIALKVFVIGTPAQTQDLTVTACAQHDGVLTLAIATPYSATAYHSWTVDTADGVADISARSVLVSPLFRDGGGTVEVPLEGVTEVRLCGRTVWQEGAEISPEISALWEARTPYVGNASAVGKLLDTLFFYRGSPGAYTFSLQTRSEPFGLTLDFSQKAVDGAALNRQMHACAPLILALVDNLGTVSWSYPTADGSSFTTTVTLAEIDALLPDAAEACNAACGTDRQPLESVKDYAASPASLRQLTELVRFYPEV
jgi:hypothetical protein